MSYLTDQDAYSVQWSGFHDPHSDVAFYRVGLGTSAGADNVVAFHYVGLRTGTYFFSLAFSSTDRRTGLRVLVYGEQIAPSIALVF